MLTDALLSEPVESALRLGHRQLRYSAMSAWSSKNRRYRRGRALRARGALGVPYLVTGSLECRRFMLNLKLLQVEDARRRAGDP